MMVGLTGLKKHILVNEPTSGRFRFSMPRYEVVQERMISARPMSNRRASTRTIFSMGHSFVRPQPVGMMFIQDSLLGCALHYSTTRVLYTLRSMASYDNDAHRI